MHLKVRSNRSRIPGIVLKGRSINATIAAKKTENTGKCTRNKRKKYEFTCHTSAYTRISGRPKERHKSTHVGSTYSCMVILPLLPWYGFVYLSRSPQILPMDLGSPVEEAPLGNDGGVFGTEGMAEALGHVGNDRPEVRNPVPSARRRKRGTVLLFY